MANLTTYFAGLNLKNPIVIGASNLVSDVDNLVNLEKAGAAAIVYKSLFEEQIEWESYVLENTRQHYSHWDPEHESMLPHVTHAGPAEHLLRLRKARQVLSIPLIGSLNCTSTERWAAYAVKMAETGIDALELNFYASDLNFSTESYIIEDSHLNTLNLVRSAVRIPLIVKLSPYYTNPLRLIREMDRIGINGVVLFNRLFQPDIDIEKEEHHFPYNFSNENDNRLALRYAGLLHGKIRASICSNTGILSGQDVIKMLLAGADAVQVVSTVYKKGINHIQYMLQQMEEWMDTKNYASIDAFKGKLSKDKLADPFAYKRAQYVDILMKSEIFMQYHPKENELHDE